MIQEFKANALNLLKKKGFFPMTDRIALKNVKKAYLVKMCFIIH